MDYSTQTIKIQTSIRKFLLEEKDYIIIESECEKYLFLSDSLRYFRIANPIIEEYLRISQTKNLKDTFLSREEIETIGKYLKEDENANDYPEVDTTHNFLILNITSGCNLACSYCFANTIKGKNAMSFGTAKQAIDNMLQQQEQETYSIYFFGGEPLLKKDLVRKITEYAYSEIQIKRKKNIQFLINTNATLIDENALTLFKQFDFTVTISIDGPEKLHNMNRFDHKGNGSFEKVMSGIQALKTHRISTNLRATITPKTENLIDVFAFFENLELPYAWSFTLPVEYKGNESDTCFRKNQMEDIDEELKKVMDFFFEKILNKEPVYSTGLMRDLNTVKYKMQRSHPCEAGRKSITVDEKGNYFACQNMIPHEETILGNLETGVLEKRREKVRSKELKDIPACQQCNIRKLCVGGCEIERFNSNFSGNGQMCHLNRIEWKNKLYLYSRIIEAKKNK